MRYLMSIIMAVSLSCLAGPCFAAGVGLSGDLEAGPTYHAGSGETLFESNISVKLELNKDEKQSGLVLLQYKAKTPQLADDGENGYNTLQVNQAYVDLSLSPVSIFRVGRQKISWGSGLAWNPTNSIGADKNRADLSNEFPGVDALNFETVFGQSSLAVLVKPTQSLDDWGKALKWATRIGHGDVALSVFQQGRANAFGLDWATSLGDYTVYSELASKAGNSRFYVTTSGGPLSLTTRPEETRYLNGVLGMNRTFAGDWTVQVEYYYNEAGWNAGEAENYYDYCHDPGNGAQLGDLAKKTGDLFGDLRQNYLYCLVRKAEIADDWTVACRVLWNMDDGGWMTTPMAEYRLGQNSSMTMMIHIFTGNHASEFGSIPTGTQYSVKVNVSF